MVVKRRLSCGFDFSGIPKAPRSTRMKVSNKGDDVDSQISAIDLLASLAGKLLEESESSSTSSTYGDSQEDHLVGKIKQEHVEDVYSNKLSKSELENTSETCLQVSSLENDCVLEQTPVSDCKMALGLNLLEETGVVDVDAGFEQGEVTKGLVADSISLKDPNHESVHMDGVPNGSLEGYRNHSKLVCRDDDENYCKYYKFIEKCNKSFKPMTRVGHRRIKKSMMKKYGRAVPRSRCFEDTRTDGCFKAMYRKRKLCYGYNPWKHETVHRKRRLSDKGLVVTSDGGGGLSCESVTNSPVKGESVKFSIKSFRIPELFIEVPETATVGSLKRTVMEAVTALLDDGIHIGVLVQGKKVRDENNTLSQSGLSCKENLDNLGFTLEPGHEKLPIPLCSETPFDIMPTTDSTNLSQRSSASLELDSRIPLRLQDADHVNDSGTCMENSQELVPYQSDEQQPSSDSRAIVPVPPLEPESLAIVPLNEKPKRTELSQRRTRRPFSVTEVEALVHAVEELGTGRWRDVKLRSFDDASHRTYVDLKDKWKTLVHTASISPQQRRGQPVPQELLDRVLAAHRYWSQHQVKQNGKHQAATTMVVESGVFM
ncbi:Telomere repeat-binding protein 4 [Hirschfeldia incana]|nr:Telomere repeat-binding protein 4 [Hirschfeldia incana]KAJ0260901.1 Telomere repeat-binding protein 4 [Hirschfeldia incana]KAJ0260902.1 Telomere repeat-binding protein 4 [Hirschfeldia incana]